MNLNQDEVKPESTKLRKKMLKMPKSVMNCSIFLKNQMNHFFFSY